MKGRKEDRKEERKKGKKEGVNFFFYHEILLYAYFWGEENINQ